MRRELKTVMLPTSDPRRGRWVHYRYRNLYPGPNTLCWQDWLAVREARQSSGYRMRPDELKFLIRRNLGFRALRNPL